MIKESHIQAIMTTVLLQTEGMFTLAMIHKQVLIYWKWHNTTLEVTNFFVDLHSAACMIYSNFFSTLTINNKHETSFDCLIGVPVCGHVRHQIGIDALYRASGLELKQQVVKLNCCLSNAMNWLRTCVGQIKNLQVH